MGWFWQSQAAPKQQPAPASQGSGQQSQAPPPPAKPTTQSEPDTDPEVAKFLEEILADMRGTRNPTSEAPPTGPPPPSTQRDKPLRSPPKAAAAPEPPTTTTTSSQTTFESDYRAAFDLPTPSSPPADEPRLKPLAESLLPTTMDCTQIFNQAFYCQSMGGQWNAIYRYGSMRSCSDQWDDFWFCMRVKGWGAEMKKAAIRAHYRQKEIEKYGPGKPSSEDVWVERKEKVPLGTAFSETAGPASVSDAEFQRAEMERTKRIRDSLT